jgi:hypothetical protein
MLARMGPKYRINGVFGDDKKKLAAFVAKGRQLDV